MNPELKRMLDALAAAREQRAEARQRIESILAAAEAADNRDLTEEEQQQQTTAQGTVEALTAKIDTLEPRIQNLRQALEDEKSARVIRTAGENQGVEISGGLTGHGPASETQPNRGYDDLGAFALSVHAASTPGATARDERLAPLAAITGMGQTIGSDGGFLVPPAFVTAIWDRMQQNESNLLPLTDQHPVVGDSLTLNASAETSRATGSRQGGVRGYWIAEGAQLTASAPTFRQIKLEPHQLAVLVYVTDKLLANAPALNTFLSRAAADEIAFMVSDTIINGTGAGQPRGLLAGAVNKPRVRVSKETGQAATTIVAENIMKMYARLIPSAIRGARWFINQDILPQLLQMHVAVGTGGVPVYLPQNQLVSSPYGTLMGLPVQPVEYCATLGTEGDIILTNLDYQCTGTKGGIESAISMHLRFDYLEQVFRFVFAVDSQPWLASSLTPYKGSSNTVGPTITLQTRS